MANDRLERIQKQFTRTADVYARMRQTTDERGLKGLVGLSGASSQDRVLDIACGPGFLTLAFAARCRAVTGFDATDAFLGMARTEAKDRSLDNVDFKQGDAECLPFDDESFEVVACRAAFHHFPDPARVLSEMARVVISRGRLLVADLVGSEDLGEAELHERIERLCDPTHVRALPQSVFHQLFENAGLTLVRQVVSSLDYDLEDWISHGGPPEAARRQIVSLMKNCIGNNESGLRVRREDGRLSFSHKVATFVLDRA